MDSLLVPAIIRGQLVTDHLVEVAGRGATATFRTPDPALLADRLALPDPAALADLHEVTFDEIVDVLAALGRRLRLDANPHLEEALEHSTAWSDYTPPVLRTSFEALPELFTPEAIREIAEESVGIAYLEGWVRRELADGREAAVRAYGARSVHIIAGNSPVIAAVTIIRNAVTRSDAIIKSPSNDPLTALAIARTLAEVAPDHPLTRHLSVAYWKGGAAEVEDRLYAPAQIEKLIAWGGLASVRHVTQYVRPGLELVTLDPKRSATIIDAAGLEDDVIDEVARRVATDVGALNQLGCVNARVVYVASGLDPDGLERANRFGERVYEQLQALPAAVSTPARVFDPELRAHLKGIRTTPDWYRVFGGRDDEGAVIVSQLDEPVEFHRSLSGRVANIVPLQSIEDVLGRIDASTQTVGVYPEATKEALLHPLALRGAQRVVTLGFAASPNSSLPQDAIEPVRRMVKWVVAETCEVGVVPSFLAPAATPSA